MKLTRVYGYWNDETIEWLNTNCYKWTWYDKERAAPFRASFLVWDEEDALAFNLRFGT